MSIDDLYHRRKELAARSSKPEVYSYDELPKTLRYQVTRILEEALGPYVTKTGSINPIRCNNEAWEYFHKKITYDFGDDFLRSPHNNPQEDVSEYLKTESSADNVLGAIDLGFRIVDRAMRQFGSNKLRDCGVKRHADEAIQELNARFRQHSIGYRFEQGRIIRIDSEFIHSEMVKPTLSLLSDQRFAGPELEYLEAHTHYKAGEYEDAIVDANRAFESVMKVICELMGSPAPSGATATNLVSCIRNIGLLPDYLDGSFDQLVSVLKAGLPAVRNNAGGHGQGSSPRQTQAYVAGYALHLCASNILFLAEAFREFEAAGKQAN